MKDVKGGNVLPDEKQLRRYIQIGTRENLMAKISSVAIKNGLL